MVLYAVYRTKASERSCILSLMHLIQVTVAGHLFPALFPFEAY